jgi:hypothetical protein
MTGVPRGEGAEPPTASADADADAVAAVRVFTVLAAVISAVPFFGVVDLSTVPSQTEGFERVYLLETGWGLLYTFLVPGPLAFWAFRPQWRVPMQQVLAVAATLVLSGLVVPYVGLVVVGLLLSAAAWGPNIYLRRPLVGSGDVAVRSLDPVLVVLVLVGGAGAVAYAADMVVLARSGVTDDITVGVRHIPMQAAFSLAVVASAAVAVLGQSVGAPGWRLCTVPAAVSAVWFGVTSLAYPQHLASLGTDVGVEWVVWGVVLTVAVWVPRPRRNRAAVEREPDMGR